MTTYLYPKYQKNFSHFFKSNLFYYAIVTILSIGILRDVLNLSHPSKDLKKSPLIPIFPEKLPTKRVLALHLSSPYYVNQYVIFKQKNKNNLSPVHINHGEVGQIIKKLEKWDHAMVDFSIDIPSRFQELKTKFIADQSDNEAILIVEEI